MIPHSVTRTHVLEALRQIDRDGVPRGRESRGYDLVYEGVRYPPKYAVALATALATGTLLDAEAFGGGEETNTLLRGLGFTVVAKDAPSEPASSSASGVSVRVGRVFLDIGRTERMFRAEAGDVARLVRARFDEDPHAYRDRIVGLIARAHAAGAEVVALPACALVVGKELVAESYAVRGVPLVIAGELQREESAVVMARRVVTERFGSREVRWLDAGRFTVLTAISSTIGKLIRDKRYEAPVPSTHAPPDTDKPILVVDVGHEQYGSRYLFQTLRCVARETSAIVSTSPRWSSRSRARTEETS